MLTKKQYDLLLLIDKRLKSDGVPPSFEEMKEALGLKSKSGIHRLITSLEERHFIRRLPHKARAIEVIRLPDNSLEEDKEEKQGSKDRFRINASGTIITTNNTEIPLYGKIAAGTPIEALRDENEFVSVPQNMLGMGEHYALKVEGDSMIEAGILNGDTVVIQETRRAEDPSSGKKLYTENRRMKVINLYQKFILLMDKHGFHECFFWQEFLQKWKR